jgi:ribose/xylose/arabinose/galactoside ABC-type transport system permease subunit
MTLHETAAADADAGEPVAGAAPAARTRDRMASRESVASIATTLAFVFVFVIFAFWLGEGFYTAPVRMFDISRSAPQLVLTIAVVVCLCAQQFDLSVAAVATGGAFITIGLYLDADFPMGLAIAVTLVTGVLAGLLNGLLVTKLGVNAFIATLGTTGLFAGFTIVYSAGHIIGPTATTRALPGWFSGGGSLGDFQNKVPLWLGLLLTAALVGALLVSFDQRFATRTLRPPVRLGILGGVGVLLVAGVWWTGMLDAMDYMAVIVFVAALLVWLVLKYTAMGQAVYAVGGSERAASFAGIRTGRVAMGTFMFSGALSSLAGVLIAATQGSAAPSIADPLLLSAYAGAFLSTVILSRGRFHVWGAVVGSIALVYITSGLVAGGVPYTWTQVINGAVLIVTVSLSTFLHRRQARH